MKPLYGNFNIERFGRVEIPDWMGIRKLPPRNGVFCGEESGAWHLKPSGLRFFHLFSNNTTGSASATAKA